MGGFMSSDELKKIFNEDCSYDEKVKKVKIAMQEKLEDANSYLTSSFSFGMTDFLWIRCIYKFMPFIPLIFGIGVLSLASFTRFFSKRKAAKDMLDHLENSNDDLNSENNNNNNFTYDNLYMQYNYFNTMLKSSVILNNNNNNIYVYERIFHHNYYPNHSPDI